MMLHKANHMSYMHDSVLCMEGHLRIVIEACGTAGTL